MCNDPSHAALADLDELADFVLGTRTSPFRGGGRNNDGIVHDIDLIKQDVDTIKQDVVYLRRKVDNGGVHIHLTKRQYTAIAGIVGIVAAAVKAFF